MNKIVLIGEGIRLFGRSDKAFQSELLQSDSLEHDLLINKYTIHY